jgi:hypothetical protein
MLNYRSAPYWEEYKDFLERTYDREWDYLADLNEHLLRWLMDEFGIETKFLRMSDYEFEGEKSELVLDMCQKLGADVNIFGELGKQYADVATFRDAGVEPVFQSYNHPDYPQLHGEFESHMSAIDLLLNCGPDGYDIMMQGQDPLPPPEFETYREGEPP